MEKSITLRRGGPDDAQAILSLTRAAYAKWVSVIGREPLPMRVDYVQAVMKHRFDLLFEDCALAALIETTPEDDDLLIENVAVSPPCQGRGYGRRLMAEAEAIAREHGLRGVRLYTNQRFTQNIRLYEKLGYRQVREETLNGGVAVHMLKRLGG